MPDRLTDSLKIYWKKLGEKNQVGTDFLRFLAQAKPEEHSTSIIAIDNNKLSWSWLTR